MSEMQIRLIDTTVSIEAGHPAAAELERVVVERHTYLSAMKQAEEFFSHGQVQRARDAITSAMKSMQPPTGGARA